MSIYDRGRLRPSDKVKFQEKAYEKVLGLPPAQEQRQEKEMGVARDRLTDTVAQAAKEGGFRGRQLAGQALGQTALEVSQLAGAQEAERDQLAFQGAGLKEQIIGQRQSAATGNFVRAREKENKALAEAITQRAFDLGMSSKELAFHNNSLVSDVGFNALATDFEAGRVDRTELMDLMYKQQLDAQQSSLAAERMLSERWGEMMTALKKGDIEEAKKRIKLALDMQKKAMEKSAKASSLGAILSGAFTIAGGAISTAFTGDPTLGAVAGSTLAKGVSGVTS